MASQHKYQYFKVTFPEEYVVFVEINRPEKLNAFCDAMWHELKSVFTSLSHDPSVRAIVLTGAGEKAFTAGLDVQGASQGPLFSRESTDPARIATTLRRHILDYQSCITSVESCEKPVISLLHGYSYGLAIDLSTATDIRLCTSNTKFCVKEVDIGLAADVGTLSRLPKCVGNYSWVKDVCLTARVFDSAEAEKVGFVSQVVASKKEGLERAFEIARLIASKSPVAVQGTKALLDYSRDHDVEEGLRFTAAWNAGMLQTQDMKDALLSGIQKRKPTFEKL